MGRVGYKYPPEIREYITANVAGHTAQELADMVNAEFGTELTKEQIKSAKANWHIKSGTPCGLPKGHASPEFPQEVGDYIRENYRGVGPKEMAQRLNDHFGSHYTASQIKGFYGNHKLNSGITGRFEKGIVPANKGKKGQCAPGCEKTFFQKGNLPHNTKPIGYERITRDGYIEVKIAMRPSRPDCNDNFVAKHRLVWEAANGPIPPGHVIIFLDGDTTNCELSNLQLVTQAENQMLNKRHLRSDDPDLTKSAIMVAKVRVAAHQRMKGRRPAAADKKTTGGP
jgi:hypothetical protein